MSEVADLRASGQTGKSAEFRTLGACAEEMLRIVQRSDRGERTRQAYKCHVDRLRTHWQRGSFESYPGARVDLDAIMELRDHLKNRAVFVAGRVGPNTKRVKKRTGFSNNIVNQTMWALRVCLDIAVDKRVRVENPFLTKSTLEKKINLPKVRRQPDLPPTDVMQKLFAEMRSVPDAARIRAQRGGFFSRFVSSSPTKTRILLNSSLTPGVVTKRLSRCEWANCDATGGCRSREVDAGRLPEFAHE